MTTLSKNLFVFGGCLCAFGLMGYFGLVGETGSGRGRTRIGYAVFNSMADSFGSAQEAGLFIVFIGIFFLVAGAGVYFWQQTE